MLVLIYCAGIEDLCTRRDELHKQILAEEEEKMKLQTEICTLTDRLAKINESLSKKMASRVEFDRTIAETEAAYAKVYFAAALFSHFVFQILLVSVTVGFLCGLYGMLFNRAFSSP